MCSGGLDVLCLACLNDCEDIALVTFVSLGGCAAYAELQPFQPTPQLFAMPIIERGWVWRAAMPHASADTNLRPSCVRLPGRASSIPTRRACAPMDRASSTHSRRL